MSESQSSSSNFIPEFENHLNFSYFIPHKLKLVQSKGDKKNFINSTLQCLTNIKSFLEYIYNILEEPEYYKYIYEAIKEIVDNIKANKNEYNPYIFSQFILTKIKSFENKSNHDPRILIEFILNSFFISNNSKNLSSLNYLGISNSSDSNLDLSFLKSNNIESDNYVEDKIKIVIKKTRICNNENCRNIENSYISFLNLHFYLKYNISKEYSIYDCFNELFKKQNEESENICSKCSKFIKSESNSLFHQLPESIFIFIYYGEEKDNNYFKKFYYKFEDIIDFTKFNYIDDNVKNKKYFLSSLIACRYPKIENDENDNNEYFYTFSRKDKDSNYCVYNSTFVNDNIKNVNSKIIKLKKEEEEFDPKRSYPYVLVYTAF